MIKSDNKALYILTIAIIFFAIVSSAMGLFYMDGGRPYNFVNQYGDTIKIYGDGIYTHDSYFKALISRGTDFTILFIAARLSNELIEAQDEKRLLQIEKQWMSADVVIVDELGYIPYHPRAAELMFQFFSARYERGSMIITSNREFSRWNEFFHDDQMTAALLDRITHKAHLFQMNGDSYRLKETYSS